MLATGCAAGGSSDGNRSSEGRGNADSVPMPAPDQPRGTEGTEEGDKSREVAPAPPDFLSTFALDVDTASYGYARRSLGEGRLPDPANVRPEEFVNSFRQDYERPDGDGFSVTVDGAKTSDPDWSLLRVGLATRGEDGERRPPAALTFAVDISGSMAEAGRLDLVRESLDLMTNRLRADDRVAIVTFSDEADTVLEMTRIGGNRDRIHDVIDDLEPTDSTNVAAGVEEGYDTAVDGKVAGSTNRVVLLSDALANVGETDADGILERIADERKEHGITLFGVGVGSEYGDQLMERLTNKGDGHTTYVSTIDEAEKVFCEQLPAHIELRARDAKAQVAFDPQTVKQFKLIGYENREVADEDFRDDRVDGGEVGPGHTVTALYAVRLRDGADAGHVATASVRWLDPDSRAPHEESEQIESSALRGSLWGAGADESLQVAAVAGYFADGLRAGSGYRPCESETECSADDMSTAAGGSLPGAPSLPQLQREASQLADSTGDGDVRALATALEQACRLLGLAPAPESDGDGGGEPEGEL
ncbi:von Willebrand factor type A domain-containing protein [Streptomyces sp. TRM66268-LWL]|uniref:von Willebrand factor type A domain-containing protein n=1 Tax=Streptomyces polyasparticus TaxID=2767826 RepID=A0ABR7SRI9_9ACTN|nr:von Willebrand factor type A domain-containing protein [Streptomyces polyasparticus]MBC9716938.1 von Willebrand factor type A domain-containing protein [Streptomyces polyasparticus]